MNTLLNKLDEKIKKELYLDSYITVFGNKEILIENVKGVFECNEIMVRLKAGRNSITVWGENLKVTSYTESKVLIFGNFSSIEMECSR